MAGVWRFQDLDCWKLARMLRREIVRLLRTAPACNDFRFSNQLRDAARGGTRNIAEGYSRFTPTEILRFLGYAKSSLDETADGLTDGIDSGYWSQMECSRARALLKRTHGAIRGWWRYLESPQAARFYQEHRRRIQEEIEAGLRRPFKDPESRPWRRTMQRAKPRTAEPRTAEPGTPNLENPKNPKNPKNLENPKNLKNP